MVGAIAKQAAAGLSPGSAARPQAMQLSGFTKPANPQFQQISASCPICDSAEVVYEFVAHSVAFSQCRGCDLLFANPRPPRAHDRPASDAAVAAVRCAIRVARDYARSEARRVAVVGHVNQTQIGGIDVLSPARLAESTATYDLIILLAALERESDPFTFLQTVSDRLSAGGSLAVLYLSISSPGAAAMRERWLPFSEKPTYCFSTDTMQLLLTRCGFGDFLTFGDARDAGPPIDASARRWFESGAMMLCRPVERDRRGLLSVIFPVYNERATVEESLRRVLDKEIPGIDIEVIVVESNSSDGSKDIVERFRDHPRVRLFSEDRPRGKGYAVRTGLQHARGDVVLFQDADLEYDVNDYEKLIAPLFELRRTFVLGSRHNSRGEAWKIRHFQEQAVLANVANLAHLILLRMFNYLYKQDLADPFTMYKVFRRDCLHGLTFECNRFDFDFEINIKLIRKGYKPIEFPVNYESRSFAEGKKVSFFGDPPTWVRAMLKLKRVPLYALTREAKVRR